MRFNQHLPSIFTLINLFLGFIAIINIQQGNYAISCYVILAASTFDSIDGKLARVLGIPTNFGKEIDSLADMVSFCLAPAFLVYALYTQNMPGISGEIIASAPLLMGAIRLARYNTIEDKPTDSFIGLPTPVNALAIASLVLFMEHIKFANPEYTQRELEEKKWELEKAREERLKAERRAAEAEANSDVNAANRDFYPPAENDENSFMTVQGVRK